MNHFFKVAVVFLVVSCNQNKKQQIKSQEQAKVTTEVVKPKIIEPVEQVPESKLKGVFAIGLNISDKNNPRDSRAYDYRTMVVKGLKGARTFYGDGKGVNFHDKGDNQYLTKKNLEKSRFEYKIQNDTLLLKNSKDEVFKLFAVIVDEGINQDYYEIQMPKLSFTLGMYKINEVPEKE